MGRSGSAAVVGTGGHAAPGGGGLSHPPVVAWPLRLPDGDRHHPPDSSGNQWLVSEGSKAAAGQKLAYTYIALAWRQDGCGSGGQGEAKGKPKASKRQANGKGKPASQAWPGSPVLQI